MTSRDERTFLATLGRRLRLIRTARELSQAELAGRARLDRTYVSRVERGVHSLTVTTLRRLAFGLDVPLPVVLDVTAPLDLRGAGSDSGPVPRRR